MRFTFPISMLLLVGSIPARGEEPTPAERGEEFLLGRAYNPPSWPATAVESVWRQWGVSERPADFDAAFRDRYGLNPAPYPNDGLPMGLRESGFLLTKGVGTDCMVCHGGSIMGRSYVGLGNASLDIHALFEELYESTGANVSMPFQFTRTRGTNEAGGMAVYLLGYRHPDLSLRGGRVDLGLRDDLCEDVPAWWLLKKKRTMYHTGSSDSRSVRSIMQFMLSPLNGRAAFEKAEPEYRDILAYIKSIEPPEYPFPIDHDLAGRGQDIFRQNCSSCHGTYGDDWTYPNKIVPLDEIGTDPVRAGGIERPFEEAYNASWFSREDTGWFHDGYPIRAPAGYQAPPLDGVWATAPYFHNGSVPTVYHVLNSGARPSVFTRSFRTGEEDYDPARLGWKFREVPPADPNLPPIERRKIYDTRRTGRGNGGHTYGDHLTEEERMAVIEYLKTL